MSLGAAGIYPPPIPHQLRHGRQWARAGQPLYVAGLNRPRQGAMTTGARGRLPRCVAPLRGGSLLVGCAAAAGRPKRTSHCSPRSDRGVHTCAGDNEEAEEVSVRQWCKRTQQRDGRIHAPPSPFCGETVPFMATWQTLAEKSAVITTKNSSTGRRNLYNSFCC